MRYPISVILLGLLILSVQFVSTAQDDAATCPAFVESALDAVGAACSAIGRNQVCYGSNAIDAEFSGAVAFATPGDTASVIDLRRLATAPLQPAVGVWGVAMLALQADLPDSLPGQNVSFIVFGGAEMTAEDGGAAYTSPMQAFRLETTITGIDCGDVPESGLLVQAPADTTVAFRVNGVDVRVGSSALIGVDSDAALTVDTIEGFVEVTSDGATEVAGEGVSVRVPRGGRPLRAVLSAGRRIARAPWRLLPRQVEAMPAVPEGQIVRLGDCQFPSLQRASRQAVSVTPNGPIVLRLTIPHGALDLARVIRQNTRNDLFVNGESVRVFTRVGPWRGERDEFGGAYGMELYWLIPPQPAGSQVRLRMESRTVDGLPLSTGIDGPDRDSRPETLPAQRTTYCVLQVGA